MPYVSTAHRELALKTFQLAAAAHGEDGQRDARRPDWHAAYMAAEQEGTELPMGATVYS